MTDLLAARLLDPAGGAASFAEGPFGRQVLTWLLLWTGGLALAHVVLALAKGRLPIAVFCLLGGLMSVAAGLWALWETLVENARRSAVAAVLWWPGYSLGLFVVGLLGAAAWTALTVGLSRLLARPEAKPEK